ncbi:hypothetical protein MNV49_006410 [Pseudohyphozyma bogoriensis]|nr:hypothetical protein MNV49_006410 [Pseudohyphozyma bogoriensis]
MSCVTSYSTSIFTTVTTSESDYVRTELEQAGTVATYTFLITNTEMITRTVTGTSLEWEHFQRGIVNLLFLFLLLFFFGFRIPDFSLSRQHQQVVESRNLNALSLPDLLFIGLLIALAMYAKKLLGKREAEAEADALAMRSKAEMLQMGGYGGKGGDEGEYFAPTPGMESHAGQGSAPYSEGMSTTIPIQQQHAGYAHPSAFPHSAPPIPPTDPAMSPYRPGEYQSSATPSIATALGGVGAIILLVALYIYNKKARKTRREEAEIKEASKFPPEMLQMGAMGGGGASGGGHGDHQWEDEFFTENPGHGAPDRHYSFQPYPREPYPQDVTPRNSDFSLQDLRQHPGFPVSPTFSYSESPPAPHTPPSSVPFALQPGRKFSTSSDAHRSITGPFYQGHHHESPDTLTTSNHTAFIQLQLRFRALDDSGSDGGNSEGKGNGTKYLMIGGLVLVVIAVAVACWYFFVYKDSSSSSDDASSTAAADTGSNTGATIATSAGSDDSNADTVATSAGASAAASTGTSSNSTNPGMSGNSTGGFPGGTNSTFSGNSTHGGGNMTMNGHGGGKNDTMGGGPGGGKNSTHGGKEGGGKHSGSMSGGPGSMTGGGQGGGERKTSSSSAGGQMTRRAEEAWSTRLF